MTLDEWIQAINSGQDPSTIQNPSTAPTTTAKKATFSGGRTISPDLTTYDYSTAQDPQAILDAQARAKFYSDRDVENYLKERDAAAAEQKKADASYATDKSKYDSDLASYTDRKTDFDTRSKQRDDDLAAGKYAVDPYKFLTQSQNVTADEKNDLEKQIESGVRNPNMRVADVGTAPDAFTEVAPTHQTIQGPQATPEVLAALAKREQDNSYFLGKTGNALVNPPSVLPGVGKTSFVPTTLANAKSTLAAPTPAKPAAPVTAASWAGPQATPSSLYSNPTATTATTATTPTSQSTPTALTQPFKNVTTSTPFSVKDKDPTNGSW